MQQSNVNEREEYYNKVILWVAFAPISIVMGLGAVVAWLNPEMFGF